MGLKMKTGEIAEVFGVTRRTVTNWKAAGCPCKSGGRGKEDTFDTAAVHQWLLAEAVGDGREKDPEIKRARLEILKTESELRRLRLKEREGELVSTEEVQGFMSEAFGGIRLGFASFVPWLHGEIAAGPSFNDTRAAYYSISERIDAVLFSVFVSFARALADLAGGNQRKAARLATDAWRGAFGGNWETELERIFENPPIPKGVEPK